MKRIFLYLVLIGICCSPAYCAPPLKIESVPLPDGPLFQRAPEFAQWTVSYTYLIPKPESAAAPPSAPPVRIQKLTVVKTNTTYWERRIFTDGSTQESWRIGSMQVSLSANSKTPQIYEPSSFPSDVTGMSIASPSLYTDYSQTDFPGIEWITAQNYLGIAHDSDHDLLVFQRNAPDASVYIDEQTRLPKRLETSEAVAIFVFEAPPQVPLSLPRTITDFLERRAAAVKTLTTTTPSF